MNRIEGINIKKILKLYNIFENNIITKWLNEEGNELVELIYYNIDRPKTLYIRSRVFIFFLIAISYSGVITIVNFFECLVNKNYWDLK